MGYDGTEAIVIEDANGSGAVLRPVMGGKFYLEANFTNADGEFLEDRVRLLAADGMNLLIEKPGWIFIWIISLLPQQVGGHLIQTETDNKSWRVFSGTSPENADTDGDGLNDFDENATFGTNPYTPIRMVMD